MPVSPFGFRAVRHLTGRNDWRTETFLVDDNNPKPIFIGHAVILSSGRVVEHTSTGNGPILGVVKACYTGTKNRPRTFSLPDAGPYVPASTRSYVEVIVDPDVIYEVVANSGLGNDDFGQLGEVVATGSGNPKTGQSRMEMSTTTFAAQTSVNNQTLPFRIIGLAKSEEIAGGSGYGSDEPAKIEVVINNHVYRQVTPV